MRWRGLFTYLPRPFASRLETRLERGMRLELRVSRPELAEHLALELNYLTAAWAGEAGGEHFELLGQRAQDIRAYGVVKDIQRVERFVDRQPGWAGAVLVLTNDPGYWSRPAHGRATNAQTFRIYQDQVISGRRAWGPATGAGTRKTREADLELRGDYRCRWAEYSALPGHWGRFRLLAITIGAIASLRRLCPLWDTARVAGSVRRELVPNALWVDLCDHTLEITGADRPCLTAVTRGLADVGQPEMVFTITGSTGVDNFPPDVLEYLEWVHGMAVDGHVVGSGGVSGFQPPGPFRLGPFLGVLYSEATPDHQVVIPPGAVQGVLVTEGELEMAMLCSPWRVLARLGQEACFFPRPFWSDPLRPATYKPGDAERSLLGKSGTPQLRLGRLDASLDSSQLDVVLTTTEAGHLAENLSTLPHLAIVPPPDPAAAATLVWSPGQTEPTAICADPALASFASARFLIILPNHGRHDQIGFQEDGFTAIISKKTTKTLVRHLRRGEAITLTTANKPSIRFIPR